MTTGKRERARCDLVIMGWGPGGKDGKEEEKGGEVHRRGSWKSEKTENEGSCKKHAVRSGKTNWGAIVNRKWVNRKTMKNT